MIYQRASGTGPRRLPPGCCIREITADRGLCMHGGSRFPFLTVCLQQIYIHMPYPHHPLQGMPCKG